MRTEIQARYTIESSASCNLSCGNNLNSLGLQPGEHVLDLGCGRGQETIEAAGQVGTTGWATGLDLTQAMIDEARSQAAAAGVENIGFVHGDIEALPFSAASYDAVISNCVINHARSKQKAYEEIHRVLKPGGRFVISDAVTKFPLPLHVKSDPAAWADCFGGALTQEEYLDSISSAGFGEIRILKRREYIKNGYDFISLTLIGIKTPDKDTDYQEVNS